MGLAMGLSVFLAGASPAVMAANPADELIRQGLAEQSLEKKIEIFTKAWELEKTYPVSLINLATAYQEKGRFDQAMVFFQEALDAASRRKDGKNAAGALFGLGDVCYAQKLFGSAWDYYREGLKLQPDDSETKKRLEEFRREMPQYFTPDGEFLFKDQRQITLSLQLKRGMGVTARSESVPLPILFDYDSAEVNPGSDPQMEALAKAVGQANQGVIVVEGHTDERGNPDYNRKLSRRRAEAVKRRLMEKCSLGAGRFKTDGFGSDKPVVPRAADESGHQKNRRVEVFLAPN